MVTVSCSVVALKSLVDPALVVVLAQPCGLGRDYPNCLYTTHRVCYDVQSTAVMELVTGKRYGVLDVIAILCMTVGLIFFTLADSNLQPDFTYTGGCGC